MDRISCRAPYRHRIVRDLRGLASKARPRRTVRYLLTSICARYGKYQEWENWCAERQIERSLSSVREYVNALFEERLRSVLKCAREATPGSIVPERYVLVVTEEIGQEKANDVSHIAIAQESIGVTATHRSLDENARVFHEYALALGSSYAVIAGLDFVFWRKKLRYAWV